MTILTIANEKFYVLMIIVIGILIFNEVNGYKKDPKMKRDVLISKILIVLYLIWIIGILIFRIRV